MDHSLIPPEAKLYDLLADIRDYVDADFLVRRHTRHVDLVAEERDPPVCIHRSGLTEPEDVPRPGVGLGQGKGANESIALAEGLVEA